MKMKTEKMFTGGISTQNEVALQVYGKRNTSRMLVQFNPVEYFHRTLYSVKM